MTILWIDQYTQNPHVEVCCRKTHSLSFRRKISTFAADTVRRSCKFEKHNKKQSDNESNRYPFKVRTRTQLDASKTYINRWKYLGKVNFLTTLLFMHEICEERLWTVSDTRCQVLKTIHVAHHNKGVTHAPLYQRKHVPVPKKARRSQKSAVQQRSLQAHMNRIKPIIISSKVAWRTQAIY